MSARFEGKVAFVSGATSGIGRATALAFGREGASVVVADVAAEGNRETVSRIEQAGGRSLAVSCDVAHGDDVKTALHAVVERFGRLDIAFNNAGIEQPIKPAHEISDEEWDRLVAVNLRGAFVSMKHEIELMLQHGGGAIVNIGSVNGQAGRYGQVNYAAAKSGIHGFTKALAQEGARSQITVNAIAPGFIDTEMVRAVPPEVLEKIVAKIPRGRLGSTNDIARGVVFLTADDADWITGSTLSINGGQHMY